MTDSWMQPDARPPENSAPERDAGGQLHASGSPVVLQEFSRWLERWLVYIQAQLDPDQMSSPSHSMTAKGPPEHWQNTVRQAPPAHWLALFSSTADGDEQAPYQNGPPVAVIRRFQADLADFLSQTSSEAIPSDASQGSSTLCSEISEKPGAGAGTPASRKTRLETACPAAPHPAIDDGLAPARVTQFKIRLPAAETTPVRYAVPPAAKLGGKILQDTTSSSVPSQPAEVDTLLREEVPLNPVVTHLRLGQHQPPAAAGGDTYASQAAFSVSQNSHREAPAEPTIDGLHTEQPDRRIEVGPNLPHSPTEQVSQEGSPLHPAPGQAEKWPGRRKNFDALQVNWPAATNAAHWPELPEPGPLYDLGPQPYRDQDRRRRIDREQGGS
jgi:hypothetical protein